MFWLCLGSNKKLWPGSWWASFLLMQLTGQYLWCPQPSVPTSAGAFLCVSSAVWCLFRRSFPGSFTDEAIGFLWMYVYQGNFICNDEREAPFQGFGRFLNHSLHPSPRASVCHTGGTFVNKQGEIRQEVPIRTVAISIPVYPPYPPGPRPYPSSIENARPHLPKVWVALW